MIKNAKKGLISVLAVLTFGVSYLTACGAAGSNANSGVENSNSSVLERTSESETASSSDFTSDSEEETSSELSSESSSESSPETEREPSEGLAYELSEDEEYYIVTSIGDCTDADLVIPATYDELPVKEVAANAFYDADRLMSVVIGDNITTIGESAFSTCSCITSVTLGSSVKTIGVSAFNACKALTSVTIPSGVLEIGAHSFGWCSGLKEVTIADSVTKIGDSAFVMCEALETITFEGGVESWTAVEKGVNWAFRIVATKVVCSDGEGAI